MRATQIPFISVLGKPHVQYVVPVFQRVYSWTARECQDLFDDVMRAAVEDKPHFVGTFLHSRLGADACGLQKEQVIDGQQRSTTMTLMLMAFVEALRAREGADSPQAERIERKLLLCQGEDAGDVQPKLKLTTIDDGMLCYMLGLGGQPEDPSMRLQDNLDLFRTHMARPEFDPEAFWRGCQLLQVIAIELSPEDAPQETFESLNSKGKRLAVEDLVRNAILSRAAEDEAMQLYENRWIPLEEQMERANGANMEDALCSWIASRHDDVHLDSKSEVFPLFKEDLMAEYEGSCSRLLDDLAPYVSRFASNEQWRRERMTELDRWLQGKPKNLISEHKIFGD